MNASIGTVIAADHQNRRVMSSSSGLFSSIVTTRGSSAMPQIGQDLERLERSRDASGTSTRSS